MSCKHLGICALAMLPLASAAQPETLSVWTHRGEIRSHFERAPERDLKLAFLICSRESTYRVLGFEEMARCSIASDVLKQRFFGGDFHALLSWWQQHRHETAVP